MNIKDLLTEVKAPNINSSDFSNEVEEMVANINTNFRKILSAPYLKGDRGYDVTMTDERVFSSTNTGAFTDFGKMLIQTLYSDIDGIANVSTYAELVTLMSSHQSSDYYSGGNVWSYSALLQDDSDSDAANVYSLTLPVIQDTKTGNKYMSALWTYIDPRRKYLPSALSSAFVDRTCVVDGEGPYDSSTQLTTWSLSRLDIIPSFYYDDATKGFCWKLNGEHTGIAAQGIKGDNGDPISSYVCLGTLTSAEGASYNTVNIDSYYRTTDTTTATGLKTDIAIGSVAIVLFKDSSLDDSELGSTGNPNNYVSGIVEGGATADVRRVRYFSTASVAASTKLWRDYYKTKWDTWTDQEDSDLRTLIDNQFDNQNSNLYRRMLNATGISNDPASTAVSGVRGLYLRKPDQGTTAADTDATYMMWTDTDAKLNIGKVLLSQTKKAVTSPAVSETGQLNLNNIGDYNTSSAIRLNSSYSGNPLLSLVHYITSTDTAASTVSHSRYIYPSILGYNITQPLCFIENPLINVVGYNSGASSVAGDSYFVPTHAYVHLPFMGYQVKTPSPNATNPTSEFVNCTQFVRKSTGLSKVDITLHQLVDGSNGDQTDWDSYGGLDNPTITCIDPVSGRRFECTYVIRIQINKCQDNHMKCHVSLTIENNTNIGGSINFEDTYGGENLATVLGVNAYPGSLWCRYALTESSTATGRYAFSYSTLSSPTARCLEKRYIMNIYTSSSSQLPSSTSITFNNSGEVGAFGSPSWVCALGVSLNIAYTRVSGSAYGYITAKSPSSYMSGYYAKDIWKYESGDAVLSNYPDSSLFFRFKTNYTSSSDTIQNKIELCRGLYINNKPYHNGPNDDNNVYGDFTLTSGSSTGPTDSVVTP